VAILKEDVAILKEDVAVLKEDVAALKEDVAILKEDVAALKEDVAILKEGQARLEKRVARLEADVADLRGDSLERRYRERAPGYFSPLVRRIRVIAHEELAHLLEEAQEQGLVSEQESTMPWLSMWWPAAAADRRTKTSSSWPKYRLPSILKTCDGPCHGPR